jgi:hypothetical protein
LSGKIIISSILGNKLELQVRSNERKLRRGGSSPCMTLQRLNIVKVEVESDCQPVIIEAIYDASHYFGAGAAVYAECLQLAVNLRK